MRFGKVKKSVRNERNLLRGMRLSVGTMRSNDRILHFGIIEPQGHDIRFTEENSFLKKRPHNGILGYIILKELPEKVIFLGKRTGGTFRPVVYVESDTKRIIIPATELGIGFVSLVTEEGSKLKFKTLIIK